MMKFENWKLMNRLINPSADVMGNIIGNIKSIFLFLDSFFGEDSVFGPLVSGLVLLNDLRRD